MLSTEDRLSEQRTFLSFLDKNLSQVPNRLGSARNGLEHTELCSSLALMIKVTKNNIGQLESESKS
jgi:hypothetical protein